MTRTTRSDATGNAFESRGRYYARPSLGGGKRKAVLLPHAADQVAADKRAAFIAGLVGQIRRAGRAPIVDLEKIVEEAAAATDEQLKDLTELVDGVCKGDEQPTGHHVPSSGTTFKAIGQDWTDGKLAKTHPDYIRAKRTAKDDEYRLEILYKEIGGTPIDRFSLDDAERAMRKLPEGLSPASRRHYAQLIARVLGLACYPMRLIKASPLPRGWLPKVGPRKGKFWLYPEEDEQLLACEKVPLLRRMLEGFLDREGMRSSEAAALQWTDISKVGEVTLDENKTDDPRAWALDRGVHEALKLWKTVQEEAGTSEHVFAYGDMRIDVEHLAEQLRDDLDTAEVERAALFKKKSANRLRLRAHDLRGTFVTLSLANGKTETWVMDRTGHKTSGMVNAYRQAARSAKELELGELKPLYLAIPELAKLAAKKRLDGSETPVPKDEGAPESANDISELCTRRDLNSHALRRRNLKPIGADSTDTDRNQDGQIGDRIPSVPMSVEPSAATLDPDTDAVETALAKAIEQASSAGRFDIVAQVARELEARRLARAGNVVALPRRGRGDGRS